MATKQKGKLSKKQQRQQQAAREKRKRWLMIGGPIVAIVVALGVFAFIRLQPVAGAINFGAQERGHDVDAGFASVSLPPVGGEHDPRVQNCGIYTEPVETALAVHSMEHGAVWITYHPDLPASDVAVLEELVRGESYTLLSPYTDLQGDVAVTAWGIQLEPDSVSDPTIPQFIERYRGGGPEPGAPCSGGVGTPAQ
jgi:hypothetical protein